MFRVAEEAKTANKLREFKTIDIVKRLGVISPQRLHLKNYPISNPVTVFNSSIVMENSIVKVYTRVIFGYYMYVSAIAMFEVDIDDIFSGYISTCHYSAELVVYPDTRYDFWGTEDPRVYRVRDVLFMTYCGRTINYFNPAIRVERTLPVTALSKNGRKWKKCCVFTLQKDLRKDVISDKDAFLHLYNNYAFIFHRPHMSDEKYYLTISKAPVENIDKCITETLTNSNQKIEEIEVSNTTTILEPAKFEEKLGWATPPIEVGSKEYVVLIHGIDRYIEAYRVFAVLMSFENGEARIKAVAPHYIMEPRAMYEVYGDRPYVVFPCGVIKLDNNLVISYGAADFMIGFGEIDLSILLSILDKHRLE